MQQIYAVVGALFIPMLALVLLWVNGRAKWVGAQYKSSFWTSPVLIATLLFFILAGSLAIRSKPFTSAPPIMDQAALQPAR